MAVNDKRKLRQKDVRNEQRNINGGPSYIIKRQMKCSFMWVQTGLLGQAQHVTGTIKESSRQTRGKGGNSELNEQILCT